jgi:hypothetical protein
MYNNMRQNSLIGIMTGSGPDDLGLNPDSRTEAFLFATMFKLTEAHPASYLILTVDCFLLDKAVAVSRRPVMSVLRLKTHGAIPSLPITHTSSPP